MVDSGESFNEKILLYIISADYGIILDGWFCPANRSRQLNMRHGTLERGTLYVPWHILSGNGVLWNLNKERINESTST